MTLEGSITALVTPFRDGRFDAEAFECLVDWQVCEGAHGLVPCGTTGESPTLSEDDHSQVVDRCIAAVAGRVPVIAGCGTNDTAATIERVRHAEQAGADAALIVTPYYNKPSQDGLLHHFQAVHDASGLPLVIYNIPGRSAVDMSVETMARLSDLERVVGVKDATGDLSRVALQRRYCGEDFIQLSGEDATALGFNAMGGRGCISVTANVAPALCAEFQTACLQGDFAAALDLQDRLIALHRAMFCEPSPAPVKYALSLLGKCLPDLRLPLAPVSEAGRATVAAAMAEAGLEPAQESA